MVNENESSLGNSHEENFNIESINRENEYNVRKNIFENQDDGANTNVDYHANSDELTKNAGRKNSSSGELSVMKKWKGLVKRC